MAKKSRRARRRTAQAARPVRVLRPVQPQPVAAQPPKEVDFSVEYHYVIEDLKRIAITAAGLFVLLIVLALVLT